MKVLLIGAYGYIGSRLWKELTEFGHEVACADTCSRGQPSSIPNARFQDYRDIPAAELRGYDAVVVFSGVSSVQESLQDPARAINLNVAALFELRKNAPDARFIYASSGSVYDSSRELKAREDWEIAASRNPYDLSKSSFDRLMQMFDWDWTGLRLGTVCGPSPNMRFDLMANKMVADAVATGVLHVSNPHANRAMLHIADLASAVNLILNDESAGFGILNLCSFNSTVAEVAKAVATETSAEIQTGPSGPTYDFSMSSSKAEKSIGFEPTFTLTLTVRSLIEFYRGEGASQLSRYLQGSGPGSSI